MSGLIDCFLYNDERELLDIRIRLLAGVVSRFVIVWSPWTFTGRRKENAFPWDSESVIRHKDRISLVTLDQIAGDTAWEKESNSRNAVTQALLNLASGDLVMVSDIDEIPRPSVLTRLGAEGTRTIQVLGLDYFNFKFNYQLVHGPQSVWPGPVICPAFLFRTAQSLRDIRWQYVTRAPSDFIYRAGWHFSFLTRHDDVKGKLESFSHQESEIQSRTDSVAGLLSMRRGFHDHLHPCTVWAIVPTESFDCNELSKLVAGYPELLAKAGPDSRERIDHEIRMSTIRMLKGPERTKVMSWCTPAEIRDEIRRRLSARFRRAFSGAGQ